MTAIRSYAWGSLLLALLIAMLLAVAVGGAAARADAPAAVADRAAAAPAPQSEWSEDSHPADGVRDRADERDEDSADAASDSDEGRNRNDIEEYFDWGHGWNGSHGARRHRRASHGDTLVNFGSDSKLPAGRHADAVVSIFGSSTSEGDADDVVSILGSTRTSGRVSDSAVAVVGSAYIDGPVGADVVAVLGDVNLGPHADVGGDVTAVGGSVIRDPAAVVRGNVQSVGGLSAGFGWLRPWIDHCLLYGRPLALVSGIGWAWALSIAFLALYVCLALLFRDGVSRCVSTVESEPGMTFVAALLTVLLAPILMVLLCITVIGIAAIPFVVFGLFCAGVFGKAVMLAWIGRRVTSRSGSREHPAVAVLIGGLIVLVLYLIPVVGFLVYKLLGLLGLGAVIYTLLLASRARRAAQQTLAGGPVPAPTVAAESGPVAGEGPTDAPQPATASAAAASAGETVAPGAASAAAAGGAPHAAPSAPWVAATLPRAGFWIRMVALLIDVLLIAIVVNFIDHRGNFELVALAIYGAVMWKLRGSTVGGIIFDLRVVRIDGRPVDWETAIVRALGCFLSMVVAGLGFFWIAFDSGKQAWHDKIAGTAVVRVPKGVPLV